MLVIQDRLSNAMNKKISSKAIWKKLNSLYDLEALDEAEAEADAAVAVETEFSLPEDEFGELMAEKRKERFEKLDAESEYSDTQGAEAIGDAEYSSQDNEAENRDEIHKGKERKEGTKRGPKKKDLTPVKDNLSMKKDNLKDVSKKEPQIKKETAKETKKGAAKEDDKKGAAKKGILDLKKEFGKEEKKEVAAKVSKRELTDKKLAEQNKKDVEIKKTDVKKVADASKNQCVETVRPRAETPKQLRIEITKRVEPKPFRAETPKSQRIETLKKETNVEKKKDAAEKKGERKSPEKISESVRGATLRTREKKETDSETPTGTKRERSRDSTTKTPETQTEELSAKKTKTMAPKGRPTRNSIEPLQKPASPSINPASPQKRRTRVS